jgi:hypothetical protein
LARNGETQFCYFTDATPNFGWKNFCTDPVGEAGMGRVVGCGMMMIGDLGGPRPPPSCASATVATVDAMTKRVTSAYLILCSSRAAVHGAGDVSTPSVGDIAGCWFPWERRRMMHLSPQPVHSHVTRTDRGSAETRELQGTEERERGERLRRCGSQSRPRVRNPGRELCSEPSQCRSRRRG